MTRWRPLLRWGIIGFSIVLLAGGPVGQTVAQTPYGIEKVQDAFAKGDAQALLDDASDRIEIGLFGRSRLYSRAQAIHVVQGFFQRYPPVGFTLQSQAQEQDSWFATGRFPSLAKPGRLPRRFAPRNDTLFGKGCASCRAPMTGEPCLVLQT